MRNHIKDLLHTLFDQQENWKIQLLRDWQTIIGDLSKQVRLEKIYDDMLVLGVYDSSWMQELYLLSYVLITTINNHLDRPRIKKLRFKRVAALPEKNYKHTQDIQPFEGSIILSDMYIAALDPIGDRELKEALKNYLIRCLRERKL